MRGLALLASAAIAATPVLTLLALILTGALAWRPALAAAAAVAAGSAGLALVWAHDVRVVRHALRGGAVAATPWLAASALLIREAERLSRQLSNRATEVERLLRAEQAIVEQLPDPLAVLGADLALQRANAAARQAFGAEMPAVLRHPGLRNAIDRALATGARQAAELNLAVPVAREVSATLIPLDPPLAGGGRLVAVLSDRTRERAVERMRADFVANASHELRTPLTSLIGFIDTLRGPAADDPPAQARFLGIMADQARRMNRLIDDLLSLSRIELIEHRPPEDRVGLGDLAARLAAAFEPRVAARGMRLDVVLPPGLPDVLGDADQLEQVLQNLLDNAVKYGRDGGAVRVTARAEAPGGRWPTRRGVSLAVADDGHGIAADQLPRLTERFYRVDKGRSRGVGGTGLGLAIVKHIVNRHRGRLVIESREGAGTTVTVWLPQAG